MTLFPKRLRISLWQLGINEYTCPICGSPLKEFGYGEVGGHKYKCLSCGFYGEDM